jgi:hypothetical protein
MMMTTTNNNINRCFPNTCLFVTRLRKQNKGVQRQCVARRIRLAPPQLRHVQRAVSKFLAIILYATSPSENVCMSVLVRAGLSPTTLGIIIGVAVLVAAALFGISLYRRVKASTRFNRSVYYYFFCFLVLFVLFRWDIFVYKLLSFVDFSARIESDDT